MKLFCISYSRSYEPEIVKALQDKGHTISYWLGHKEHFERVSQESRFSDTLFHHNKDALAGKKQEDVDTSHFVPVGVGLIEAMQHCEQQVMTLMEHFDHVGLNLRHRRHVYHQYLWYWDNVLETYAPDAILFNDAPHAPHYLVIYHLAKARGIRTIMYKRTKGFPDRILFFDDFTDYRALREHVVALQEQKDLAISTEVTQFFDTHRNMSQQKKLSKAYLQHSGQSGKGKAVQVIPQWKTVLRNLRNGTMFRTIRGYVGMLIRRTHLLSLTPVALRGITLRKRYHMYKQMRSAYRAEYDMLSTPKEKIDWDAPYIYVPLHYQPECTTNPLGGVFDAHHLMIRMLSASLPDGWKLYVKENPSQWSYPNAHMGRFPGYYEELASLGNVVFVPTTTSSIQLSSHSRAVGTVTSTAGFEGLVRGKPVLLFGTPWYMDAPGVFQIKNADDCKNAIAAIVQGVTPSEHDMEIFLQATEDLICRGYIHKRHAVHSAVTQQQLVDNIVSGITHCLKS